MNQENNQQMNDPLLNLRAQAQAQDWNLQAQQRQDSLQDGTLSALLQVDARNQAANERLNVAGTLDATNNMSQLGLAGSANELVQVNTDGTIGDNWAALQQQTALNNQLNLEEQMSLNNQDL